MLCGGMRRQPACRASPAHINHAAQASRQGRRVPGGASQHQARGCGPLMQRPRRGPPCALSALQHRRARTHASPGPSVPSGPSRHGLLRCRGPWPRLHRCALRAPRPARGRLKLISGTAGRAGGAASAGARPTPAARGSSQPPPTSSPTSGTSAADGCAPPETPTHDVGAPAGMGAATAAAAAAARTGGAAGAAAGGMGEASRGATRGPPAVIKPPVGSAGAPGSLESSCCLSAAWAPAAAHGAAGARAAPTASAVMQPSGSSPAQPPRTALGAPRQAALTAPGSAAESAEADRSLCSACAAWKPRGRLHVCNMVTRCAHVMIVGHGHSDSAHRSIGRTAPACKDVPALQRCCCSTVCSGGLHPSQRGLCRYSGARPRGKQQLLQVLRVAKVVLARGAAAVARLANCAPAAALRVEVKQLPTRLRRRAPAWRQRPALPGGGLLRLRPAPRSGSGCSAVLGASAAVA